LVVNPAGGVDCSPAGVRQDENLAVKQNKNPVDEPSVKSDIVQTRKQADKRHAPSDIYYLLE
jgi:hypothetical protein